MLSALCLAVFLPYDHLLCSELMLEIIILIVDHGKLREARHDPLTHLLIRDPFLQLGGNPGHDEIPHDVEEIC